MINWLGPQALKLLDGPVSLVEVFCGGESQLVRQETKRGGVGLRVGLDDGQDLSKHRDKLLLKILVRETEPLACHVAWPCKDWGSWSRVNRVKTLETAKRIEEGRTLSRTFLVLFKELWHIQTCKARSCSGENPETSEAWQELGDLPGAHWKTVCQCMLDLKNPVTGIPWRKATWIVFSQACDPSSLDEGMCDKSHEHEPIEGHVCGVPESQLAEHYTESLAKSVLDSIPQLKKRRSRKVQIFLYSRQSSIS